jgi:hypothetical protein
MTLLRVPIRNLLIASTAFLAATLALPAQSPSYVMVSSSFAVESPTQIPGKVLKPGSYTVEIVDHLHDRFILRVADTQGKEEAMFIGLKSPDFAAAVPANHPGPVFWPAAPRGQTALRGFSFANGTTLEFVYPKLEAVALAKLNPDSIPAIDPESEGRKPDPRLSKEDREVVTLWMLNSIRIGKDHETPAIEARRFDAAPEPTQATATIPSLKAKSKTYQIAENDPLPYKESLAESKAKRRPVVSRLPQTGSQLPLLLLTSVVALCAAEGLARRDRISSL